MYASRTAAYIMIPRNDNAYTICAHYDSLSRHIERKKGEGTNAMEKRQR